MYLDVYKGSDGNYYGWKPSFRSSPKMLSKDDILDVLYYLQEQLNNTNKALKDIIKNPPRLRGKAAFADIESARLQVLKDKLSEEFGLHGDLPAPIPMPPTKNNDGLVCLFNVPKKFRQLLNQFIPYFSAVVFTERKLEQSYITTFRFGDKNIRIPGLWATKNTHVYHSQTMRMLFDELNISTEHIQTCLVYKYKRKEYWRLTNC